MRIWLFIPCYIDALFPEVGIATLELLERFAQHLIALLDPAHIVVNRRHVYRPPEFRDRRYGCFHTSPSATADIEGVLIHGAPGVRSLSVLPIARTLATRPIETERESRGPDHQD